MPTKPTSTDTWAELLIQPENRSAVRAARRLVGSFQREVSGPRFAQPLMFHGPTGCGKSLLLRTLVVEVVGSDRPRTGRIVSAGELPRQADEMDDLRTCDLLAVEDVQLLHAADVQSLLGLLDVRSSRRRPTVITSNAGPASLVEIPHRMTNRLAAGLVIRIDPFGLISRKRFAEWHAERGSLRLSAEAIDWLARSADGLRHLAGMIDTLRTVGSVGKGELSAPVVQELLAAPVSPAPQLDRITRTVAQAFRVKAKDLIGASRLRTVLVPRQVAMFLARVVVKLPLTVIGRHFGGRDHTTVLNAIRKIEAAIEDDVELAGRVRELRRGLE